MIEIKQGDTRHAIQATLMKSDGSAVDLSNASVKFQMGLRGRRVIDSYAQQTQEQGEVWYVFNEGETDVPGFYNMEFIVTYADGKVETFPYKDTLKLRIRERIGGV